MEWLLLIVFPSLISLVFAGNSLITWVPVKTKDLERILALADLKKGDVFYDLGCGEGKVVNYIAKNSEATAIGLEIAIPLYLACLARRLYSNNKNARFKFKDLFKEDLSSADAVYIFGIPEKLEKKFLPKVSKEMKPGSKIISYAFPIGSLRPDKIDKPGANEIPIYLYRI